ncbi:MAG: GAF domain-containing protein [Hydrogenophaga sp.]|nr:ATP-binding protein [Hydrogenophaga sp.]NIN26572.1 GAF domain-containing protein [Hydrogenophaga sp.]NIN55502.1 GAF domain-containing protein [Hydrogenophaga sp.]NIO51837.1 GAF domain-containing protein [Hydrogenophaga sp.]NIQ46450.1 GAF domain-containing protein [Hydrogenophaga sp.]NIS97945.1 GAF domain-containing protein [Hydrogenophaga sp.]
MNPSPRQPRAPLQPGDSPDTYLLALNDALRPIGKAGDIVMTASRMLGQYLGAQRVAYFEMRGRDYFIEHDYVDGVPSLAGRHPAASFGQNLLARYRSGHTVVATDVARDDSLSPEERACFAGASVGAYIGVPLVKNGEFVVGLGVHASGRREWTHAEVALVEETAERTWAAVERALAEAALARSEHHYRTLFDSIDQGMCLIEVLFDEQDRPQDYRFLQTNAAFERQTGLVNATGKRMRELAPAHETFWYDVYGDIARTGKPQRFEHAADALGRHFDVFAFRVGGALDCKVAILFSDITQRKRQEAELHAAHERKDVFLATLAHELRNPLAPILNGVHILRQGGTQGMSPERVHEILDRQVSHLARLVDDLMEISRITRGKVELRPERVNLARAVHHAIDTSQPLIDEAGHTLSVELPDEPVVLHADPVRLAQILSNLLNNAAKYTPPGGHIRVSARQEDREAVVSVRDNGMGIAPDMLQRVFEPFTQADLAPHRAPGGLGIGLTLARSLVQLHGGSVEARSDGLGQGSEFVVRLPLAAVSVTAHRNDWPTKREVAGTSSLPPPPAARRRAGSG